MKKLIVYLLATLTILSITACQPTPEKPTVAGKSDFLSIPQSENVGNFEWPISYAKKVYDKSNNLLVEIDAKISHPNINNYTIAEVKPAKFSQGTVDRLINNFSKGSKLISANAPPTKSEIEKLIIEAKAQLHNADDESLGLPSKEVIETYINSLYSMIESASENSSEQEATSLLAYDHVQKQEILDVTFDSGKDQPAHILVKNCNDEDYFTYFTFDDGELYHPIKEMFGKNAKGLTTTTEDACKIADSLLKDLGLDKTVNIFSVETGMGNTDPNKQGYYITCVDTVNDIPITYSLPMLKAKTSTFDENGMAVDYVPRLDKTQIIIYVDDSGVTGFRWLYPVEQVREVSKGVALLDFTAIEEKCEQTIKSMLTWSKDFKVDYKIDRVELGLSVIPEKDKIGYFLLVPSWTFFGNTYYDALAERAFGYGGGFINPASESYTSSLFVINAIDGSIIL